SAGPGANHNALPRFPMAGIAQGIAFVEERGARGGGLCRLRHVSPPFAARERSVHLLAHGEERQLLSELAGDRVARTGLREFLSSVVPPMGPPSIADGRRYPAHGVQRTIGP